MSLAAVARDFERLAKKARTSQKTRRECIDAILQELEKAKATLDGMHADQVGGSSTDGVPDASVFDHSDPMDEDPPAEATASSSAGSEEGSRLEGVDGGCGCEDAMRSLEQAVVATAALDSMAADDKDLTSMMTKLGKVRSSVLLHRSSRAFDVGVPELTRSGGDPFPYLLPWAPGCGQADAAGPEQSCRNHRLSSRAAIYSHH